MPKSPYDGPLSDHFDGTRFQNQVPTDLKSFWEVVKWQFFREAPSWPTYTKTPPGPKPPERVDEGNLRVTFVNHATVLIQMDGLNILTDPIWSMRPSPFSFMGPKRSAPPGIRFGDLPPVDVVLISHNHYDHFDVDTLDRLAEAHQPEILLGLGNGSLLRTSGIPGGHEMDWWEVKARGGLRFTFVPAQHWSARGLKDRSYMLWGGFVIEGPSGVVYFAGDTGSGPHFEQVRDRFPEIRLALLPIGAYKPRWFMKEQHMSPADALEAHRLLNPGASLAIHFGTFPLADDGPYEAPDELKDLLAEEGPDTPPFWVLINGEARDVPVLADTPTLASPG